MSFDFKGTCAKNNPFFIFSLSVTMHSTINNNIKGEPQAMSAMYSDDLGSLQPSKEMRSGLNRPQD